GADPGGAAAVPRRPRVAPAAGEVARRRARGDRRAPCGGARLRTCESGPAFCERKRPGETVLEVRLRVRIKGVQYGHAAPVTAGGTASALWHCRRTHVPTA